MTQPLLPQFLRTVLLLILRIKCLLGKMIGLLANVQLKGDSSEKEINYGERVAVVVVFTTASHLRDSHPTTLQPTHPRLWSHGVFSQTWGFTSHESRGKGQEDYTDLERQEVSGPERVRN